MTMRKNFDSDCPRAWDSMPWVLQDIASPEQTSRLKKHIAECDACRAEFAQQARLQRALSLPADVRVDAEKGLQRLLARLDAPESTPSAVPARATNWIVRALAAAVLVQAIGIGMLGTKLQGAGDIATYRTLSQDSPPTAAGAIRLVPDASMTLAEWDALLRAQGLHVIDGPNEVGAYTVVAVNTASLSSHALEQLRALHGIRLAEPVAARP